MTKIILGYVIFNLYIVLVLLLGILLEKKTRLDKTLSRKISHLFSAPLWLVSCYFFGCTIHWVILNGLGAVAIFLLTYAKKFKSFDRDDSENNYGMFYYSFSTFIVSIVCLCVGPEIYLYSGIAYFCLSLGDGLAPITARVFKKWNVMVSPTRSLIGSLTVFIVSFFASWIFSLAFKMDLDILFIFSIAALTCVAEFYGVKGTDNLMIEFMVFGYLLLHHYGLAPLMLEIIILTTPWLAMLMISTRSLDISGGITTLVLILAMGVFGGVFETVYTTIYFLIATLVAAITGRLYAKKTGVKKEKHTRTGRQIVAVGLVPLTFVIVSYFTKEIFFQYLFTLAITEQFADSMASDIGRLTNGKNVDIIGFKPIEKGLSGGISLLGTLVALFSCFFLPLIPFLFNRLELIPFLLIGAFAFVGVLVDSVLGSLFQVLYLCPNCGKRVETPNHCEVEAEKSKGFRIIDNTMVNLLTGVVCGGLGCFLLLL